MAHSLDDARVMRGADSKERSFNAIRPVTQFTRPVVGFREDAKPVNDRTAHRFGCFRYLEAASVR